MKESTITNNWISVLEKKPKNKAIVLVNCEHGITIGEYTKFDNGNEMWWVILRIGTYEDAGGANEVTHWMELPTPPINV
jgi:hypothetical protein